MGTRVREHDGPGTEREKARPAVSVVSELRNVDMAMKQGTK